MLSGIRMWHNDVLNKLLLPVMIPPGYNAVPPEVLNIFHCKCSCSEPCYSNICSCCWNKLSSSIFCACYGETCYSEWTVREEYDEENRDDAEGEDEENEM